MDDHHDKAKQQDRSHDMFFLCAHFTKKRNNRSAYTQTISKPAAARIAWLVAWMPSPTH